MTLLNIGNEVRCGRRSVETASIPGRPQSANGEDTIHVEKAILEDRRINAFQLAQDDKTRNEFIVPRFFWPCAKPKEGDFFDRLITQEETWVCHNEPETKAQSKQWKHFDLPSPKKAHVTPSAETVGGYQNQEVRNVD
nr:uncharacterized protein LOC113814229 [Penaeus vannamei]